MPRLTSSLQERVIFRSPFWLQLQSITIIPSGILTEDFIRENSKNKRGKRKEEKSSEERLERKKKKREKKKDEIGDDDEFVYPLNQLNLIK